MPRPDVSPSDPILAALDRAPRVQRLTPEQRAELERDLADIAAGRARLVAHEDLPRALEELARGRDG
ncbi:hypothetical protein BE20_31100 [Sorangium cellulosum]|uniref:Uncharacterized protein n=1 Tax=Sorangium cellulosum TaxID=56 RepID=A0A150ST53_SORCE|nr:hypothetical protein BE18_35015 [Sorangium cellulosum]KYF99504.1 hypothetical protein BE20_31100 [Sorangium cellulosum]